MQCTLCETVGVKHDLDLQRSYLFGGVLGHEKLLDPVEMNLLFVAPDNQWVLPESPLHRPREGGCAGSLLGTRTPEPFWQHCKRRGVSVVGEQCFARPGNRHPTGFPQDQNDPGKAKRMATIYDTLCG